MRLGDYAVQVKGRFLKASDLNTEATYTIANATTQELRGKTKIVLEFAETPARLVLNKTNAGFLFSRLGNVELNELQGHKITLIAVPVQFSGQIVSGIRIKDVQ